jgi:hypothetical protein
VPFAQISFEMVTGINIINTKNFEEFKNETDKQFNDKPNFQSGVIMHLWMPRTSENFFFRSGFLFTNADANWTRDSVLYIDNDWNVHSVTIIGEETKVPIFKIPMQIEYIYPKGLIRPKVAYGLNIYSPFAMDLSLICGLNVALHKSFFININYDYEYYGIIIPKETMSHSVLFGFQINL